MKIVEVKKIVGPSKVNEHFVEVKVKSDSSIAIKD